MRMVALGEPERAALDTLWNLGFLTAGQFSRFRGRCTRRWAEEVLSNLHRRSIVERTRRAPSWEPPSRGPRPYVYYLGERGVALAGRLHGGLTPGRARKAYRGVCREDLLDHALLRNEYAAEVAVAAWGHKGGLVVDGVYGERDAGRYTYPSQEKSPGCRPDAAIVVSDEVSYERKLVILVEAHIGTQDSTRVMSRKVNGYCKRGGAIANRVLAEGPEVARTCVVFVSPTDHLAVQALRLASGVEKLKMLDYAVLKRSSHAREDPAELFLFTDLEFVRDLGAFEPVYMPLGNTIASRSLI